MSRHGAGAPASAAVAVAALLSLATGCSGGSGAPEAVASHSTPSRMAGDANAACSPAAVQAFVSRFLAAYNTGDPDIMTMIAPSSQFQWFGQPDRPFPESQDSRDRSTLPAYLSMRHAKGDYYTLTGLTVGDDIDAAGNRGFGIRLLLSGSVPAPQRYGGKGAITCSRGQLAVWLVGKDTAS